MSLNFSEIFGIEITVTLSLQIRVTVDKAAFGSDSERCSTVPDPHTGRPTCAYVVGSRTSELRLWEVGVSKRP